MHSELDLHKELRALYPRLWRFCLATTGTRAHADDLAQTTCVKALEKLHQFKRGTAFDSWLFRISKNTWINEMRSQAVRRGGGLIPVDDANLSDPGNTPESNFSGTEVFDCLMGLPEAQRITAYSVYVEGFSYRETADLLDIPIGTVMSRLAAARRRMSAELAGVKNVEKTSQPG